MKHVILISALLLSIVVTLISCVEYVPTGPVGAVALRNNEFQIVLDSLHETDFTHRANVAVVMAEGCEYIVWTTGYHEVSWTHKGNCASCRKLQRQLQ